MTEQKPALTPDQALMNAMGDRLQATQIELVQATARANFLAQQIELAEGEIAQLTARLDELDPDDGQSEEEAAAKPNRHTRRGAAAKRSANGSDAGKSAS